MSKRRPLPYTSHAIGSRPFVDLSIVYGEDDMPTDLPDDAIARVRVSVPAEHRARWEAEGSTELADALGNVHFAYPAEVDRWKDDPEDERRVITSHDPTEALEEYLSGLGLDKEDTDLARLLGLEVLDSVGM